MELSFLKGPTALALCVIGMTSVGCDYGDYDDGAAPADAEGPVADADTPPPPAPVVPPPAPAPAVPGPVAAGDSFSIDLVVGSSITPSQAEVLQAARRRWEQVIVRGLPDAPVDTSVLESACGLTASEDRIQIDDLVIVAAAESIDGPGQVLGRAGPCIARADSGAPLVGVMIFDEADLETLESAGRLGAVFLHEMGHVLGIGTLWADASLVENPSLPDNPDADTRFVGAEAARVADALIGSGRGVPVENGARPGSSDGHWREAVFGDELMTPALGGLTSEAPLSALTIASLEDLGFYVTDRQAADSYTVSPPVAVAGLSVAAPASSSCRLVRPAAYVSSGPEAP